MEKRKKLHHWLKKNAQTTHKVFDTDSIDRSPDEVPYRIDYIIYANYKSFEGKYPYVIGCYGKDSSGKAFYEGKVHVWLAHIISLAEKNLIEKKEVDELMKILDTEVSECGQRYKLIY